MIMKPPMSRRSLLNSVGILILLAGIGTGGFIYRKSLKPAPEPDYQNDDISPEDSRVYQRNIQLYQGTFGLIADQWARDFAKLGEPKPLSITIAVVAVIAAGGCFKVASCLDRH